MYVIDQAHWLATQEILIQTRKRPSALKQNRGRRFSIPIDWGDSQPATATSHDNSLSALERDLGFKLDGVGSDVWSDSEGPIVETPMGMVRPWPRRSEQGENAFGPFRMKNGIDGPEASKGAGGLPWNGNREPRTEPRKPFMEDRKSSVNDSDWEAFGSDFSETPIIETPMGTVRPTGMRWRLNRDRREGRVGNVIPPGERTVENGDMGPRSAKKTFPEGPERPENGSDEFAAGRVEEQIVRTLMENLRASERRPGSPWNERNGHDVTSPAWFRVVDTEREAGLSEDSTTQTPAEDLSLGKNRKSTISAAFKSMVEKFLPDIRQITHPAARTDLGHHESLSSRHEAQATNQNITEADDLHSITTLTLLTEDVRALASFYTAVLGAALAPSTSATSSCITLAFTPQLAVRILNSGVARDHAIFGDYVTLGRQAATPKRVMLGVEVHDVDAVWRRLRDLGHGQKEDDGQETLGDVTTVGGRRSVCFVDLAGHCWEVWQRWEEVRDGQ